MSEGDQREAGILGFAMLAEAHLPGNIQYATAMNGINFSHQRLGPLDCAIVDALPAGGLPRLGVVLCHGFGAPGTDLIPLTGELLRLAPSLAGAARFVFPAAPLSLDEQGMYGGRAWWMIDIEALNRAIQTGQMRDQRQVSPQGLTEASQMLSAALEEFQQQNELRADQLVLGGFSQGSMVATDVALRMPEPPAGLAILSGTLLCEGIWRDLAHKQKRLTVLQCHGRLDPIVPFQSGLWLCDMLREAGHEVDFIEFNGPHTIPSQAMEKLALLLQGIAEGGD